MSLQWYACHVLLVLIGIKQNRHTISLTITDRPHYYTTMSSFNKDCIPGEYGALGLLVSSNIIYLFMT